jgi:glycerol-1-phosphate dehydrogenase [NAD(P)+]
VETELPTLQDLDRLLESIEAPKTLAQIGIDEALLPTIFYCTKDIRDKYVLSRLMWDLGILEEMV